MDLINFLSTYFELIFAVNFGIAIVWGLAHVAAQVTELRQRFRLAYVINRISFSIVLIGQLVLLSIYGYVFWVNYQRPVALMEFPKDLIFHTYWVKNHQRIYFVDDKTLRSVKLTGDDPQDVFEAEHPIREYHFSPNGHFLLISTTQNLYFFNLKTKRRELIDTLVESGAAFPVEREEEDLQGVITGIRWAPDSEKFCYEISRWSNYSSSDLLHVYDIANKKTKLIPSPTRRISSLYWDRAGENLYYLKYEAKDTSKEPYPFEIHVYRIAVDALPEPFLKQRIDPETGVVAQEKWEGPQLVARIPSKKNDLPIANLGLRGIDLYFEGDQLAFGKLGTEKMSWISDKGAIVGIDQDDFLYFTYGKWFRKRLFKIPREPDLDAWPQYQYKGGPLTIREIRWLPDGRYVIMIHKRQGVLVLDPFKGKMGKLLGAGVDTLGWYWEKK